MIPHRARQAELLDDPSFDPLLAARSYRLMAGVNRSLGGTRMVRRWIMRQLRELARVAPQPRRTALRILDIGSGGCDIPIAVSRQLRRKINIQWTCLEPSPVAREIAAGNIADSANEAHITLLSDDVFHHQPEQPYDFAVGSMFFHHLDDDAIVRLVLRLKSFVRHSLLINDLLRSCRHHLGARIFTLLLPAEIRHDALLSILRSFRPGDLARLLTPQNLRVDEFRDWLFRYGAVVHFEQEPAR